MYLLGTWFVSGICVWLHKGDDDDDYDDDDDDDDNNNNNVLVAVEGRSERRAAAQNQTLQTKYHAIKILQPETESK
jgi:hypothetical protein